RRLLECLEAQALGVEESAIHIEDGAENVFTVKEKHWLLPLVVASGTPPATGENGVRAAVEAVRSGAHVRQGDGQG
ncbi:hypothetical protein DKX15_21680, partial [Enterococcus faecium]